MPKANNVGLQIWLASQFDFTNHIKKHRVFQLNTNKNAQFTAVRANNVSRITVPCNASQCYTCPFINSCPLVDSNSTSGVFVSNASGTCTSENVVYVIECKKCGRQYIGETTQSLRQRFTQHRNNIICGKNKTPLVRHFNSPGHSISDVSIKVLEKFDNDDAVKNNLLHFELLWIKALNTAFPFGLNDKIGGYGCATDITEPSSKNSDPYFSFKTPRKKRSHGARKRSRCINNNFVSEFENLFASFNEPTGIRSIFCFLKRQNKATLKHYVKFINCASPQIDTTLKLVFMAYTAGYFRKLDLKKVLDNRIKFRIPVYFPNKGMEDINYTNIWYDKSLNECLPDAIKNKIVISTVFKYNAPLSLSFFNYSKFLKRLTVRKLLTYSKYHCKCADSPFIYKPAKHVITGDLSIIKCRILRSFFSKGAKYRMPKPTNLQEVKAAALQAIDLAIAKINRKYSLPINQFDAFKGKYCDILNSRINGAQSTTRQVVDFNRRELGRLQEQFIIVPADKAANNYIFICKKYYAHVIGAELGISFHNNAIRCNGNNTYVHCPLPSEAIIKQHVHINKQFGLHVSTENLCLPKIFSNPKIHKNPYGWRFIAGAKNSTIKPIGCLLQKILKHFRLHLSNYCNVIKNNTGSRAFVSISSSQEAINIVNMAMSGKAITSVATFDFTSLFTSIPHKTILNALFGVTKLCLHNSHKAFVCVRNNHVFYTNSSDVKNGICLNENDIFELISKVLEQTYVQFAGLNFKQVIGVPMGGNASSQIADLTLAFLEMEYFKKKKGAKLIMCRYIDDLLVLNEANFTQVAKEIYPPELELKQTNPCLSEAVFLDTNISVTNKNICLKIFDKTDAFPFNVVKVGCSSSNMHSNVGYNMFYTQIIRFLRITNCVFNLRARIRLLFLSFINARFTRERLVKKFFQLVNRHGNLFIKFNLTSHKEILIFSNFIFAD